MDHINIDNVPIEDIYRFVVRLHLGREIERPTLQQIINAIAYMHRHILNTQ